MTNERASYIDDRDGLCCKLGQDTWYSVALRSLFSRSVWISASTCTGTARFGSPGPHSVEIHCPGGILSSVIFRGKVYQRCRQVYGRGSARFSRWTPCSKVKYLDVIEVWYILLVTNYCTSSRIATRLLRIQRTRSSAPLNNTPPNALLPGKIKP